MKNIAPATNESAKRGLLISDFNLENLSAYITNDSGDPKVRCILLAMAR